MRQFWLEVEDIDNVRERIEEALSAAGLPFTLVSLNEDEGGLK